MRSLRKLAIASALPICLIPASVAAEPDDPQALREMLRDRTLFIKVHFVDPSNTENVCTVANTGSGVLISEAGHVLSVAHILRPPDDCVGFTEPKLMARVGYRLSAPERRLFPLETDEGRDLGIYWFGPLRDPEPHAALCRRAMRNGDWLLGAGFPQDADWTALNATFQNDQGILWAISEAFTYGHSGGPMVDEEGRLVAIIKGGVTGEASIRYAVPIQLAGNLLDYAGISTVAPCVTERSEAGVENADGTATDVDDTYVVDIKFQLEETFERPATNSLTRAFGNAASCTEGWREHSELLCLADGRITDVPSPGIISQRHTGRTWYEFVDGTPNCIRVFFGYSDEGRDILGACKGNGWIEARWDVRGMVVEPMEPQVLEEIRAIPAGAQSLIIEPPSGAQNAANAYWSFRATLSRRQGNEILESFLLTPESPAAGGFMARQLGDGTLVLEAEDG